MRPLTFLPFATITILGLACTETTAVSPDGPAFFRASLNGRSWRPTDTTLIDAAFIGDTLFSLVASRGTATASTETMGLGFVRVAAGRTTRLGQSLLGADAGYIGPLTASTPTLAYLTDSVHTGLLWIDAIDRDSHTISGSFSFDAASAEATVAHIRDGSFRVRYRELAVDPLSAHYRWPLTGRGPPAF